MPDPDPLPTVETLVAQVQHLLEPGREDAEGRRDMVNNIAMGCHYIVTTNTYTVGVGI